MLINGRKDGWRDDWWTEKRCSPWSAPYLSALEAWIFIAAVHNTVFSRRWITSAHNRSHLCLYPTFSLHLHYELSVFGSYSLFSSLRATALALFCISSAGFEAIAVQDHYQTRPKERVGGREMKKWWDGERRRAKGRDLSRDSQRRETKKVNGQRKVDWFWFSFILSDNKNV